MSKTLARMDSGMRAAVRAAGGARPLAAKLGISRQAVEKMATCPQARVFEVAEKAGVPPLTLRPDLEDWILAEQSRRRMVAARARYAILPAALGEMPKENRSVDDGMQDLLIALAAARFAAQEREVPVGQVMYGRRKVAAGARAWAMALALVVGRARATAIGVVYGTSRQNVDNASERYLRARDGDDPDDFLAGEDGAQKVLERGRRRPVKVASVDLWAAEARFRAVIEPGEPERRRA